MTILSAILTILSRFWKPIAAILGGMWLRRDAVNDERLKARARAADAALKAERERNEADIDAARGNARERLHRHWTR